MMRSLFARSPLLCGKPACEIPVVAPEDLPSMQQIGDLLSFWRRWVSKYGPIFKAPAYVAPGEAVYIHQSEDIHAAYRAEGKYPSRGEGLSEFNEYLVRDKRWRTKDGAVKKLLVNVTGSYGMQLRHAMQKNLMSPAAISVVGKKFLDGVAVDFKSEVARLSSQNPDKSISSADLVQLTSDFAFEAAGTALYGRRLGVLGDTHEPTPGAEYWARSIRPFIMAIVEMCFHEDQSWRNGGTTPAYEKYADFWKCFVETGEQLLDHSIRHLPEDVPSTLHDCLESLKNGNFEDMDEVNLVMFQTMGAAVDTTANSVQWALHHIVTNPDVQAKAREEILSMMPNGQPITLEKCQKLAYLKAIIYESFRLTPTAFFGLREVQQDVELAGYDIPAGTYVQMNQGAAQMDSTRFSNPEEFNAERWLKFTKEEAADAHVKANNFGRGPRMCVGSRLAKAELLLALTTLIKHFELKPTADYVPPTSKYFIVNQPNPAPTVCYIPRQSTN